MPEGRHNLRTNTSRRSGNGFRARYVQPPARRTLYAQNQTIDGVLKSNKTPSSVTDEPDTHSHHKHPQSSPSTRNKHLKPAMPRQTKSAVLARHAIQRKPNRRTTRPRPNVRLSVYMVWVMAILFGVSSTFGYISWRNGQHQQQTVLARNTDEASQSNELSEKDVSPEVIAGYEVDAELPRILSIPRLEVEARVKRMVTRSNGELTAPRNINDAGWYDGSVTPGKVGTALLVGHVFGGTKPGILNKINNVRVGDNIQVERGDGKLLNFVVSEVEHISREEFSLEKALKNSDGNKSSLHLLTHSGRYDVRTNKYEKRVLIRAFQQ